MHHAEDDSQVSNPELRRARQECARLRRRAESLVVALQKLRRLQRRMAQHRTESEERFRLMADAAPILLWMADADGHCTFFNQVWLAFTGHSLDQERGAGWSMSVHPEDRKRCLKVYREAIATRSPFELEYRLRRFDGEYRWILDKGLPRFSPEGECLGFIGSATDVTDLKLSGDELAQALVEGELARRTAELQRAYRRLHELDQLKSSFMSAVSHELRTPLTTIQGFAEFLEDEVGGALSEEQRHFVAEIMEGALRLKGMVDDLLDFTQLNAGALTLVQQEIDLGPAIEEAAASVREQAEAKQLSLSLSLPHAPLVVWADEGRIRQVMLHLLTNAVKFTEAGGIEVVTLVCGQAVRVEVKDSGIGISPDHLAHMFERFYQVDNSYTRTAGGAGLGLSLSKALVEAHGGAMGVDSRLGCGSTFWFTLPLSRPVASDGRELRITLMSEQDVGEFSENSF